ncbi:TIGR00180 family glycosyltransferase [Candidatus Pelagibacter sp.]|nr:TIGR00180 family glycosyltransferase [Candidatus Pelagibacter sp.]
MNLTIIVPTLNRSVKLGMWLDYYFLNNYKGKILIIDSSNEKEKKKNILLLKKFSSLNINYVFIKKKNFRFNFLKIVKKKIKTKYVIWCGDDDFILIKTLKYLIKFLNNNRKYGGACGLGLVCYRDKKNFITYKYNGLREIENQNSFERLKSQFYKNKYTVSFYSVLRSTIWKNLKEQNYYKSNDISAELFFTFSIAYLTRIKQFKNLIYLVRMLGHKRAKISKIDEEEILKFSNFLNQMLKKDFKKKFKYKKFKDKNSFFYSLLKEKFNRENNKVTYPFRQIINTIFNFHRGKKFHRLIRFFRIKYIDFNGFISLTKKNTFKNHDELNNFIKFLKDKNY